MSVNKIIANYGCVFAKRDKSEVYGNFIYLGIYDSVENYIQITIDEAEKIKIELEENAKTEE